MKKLRVGRRVGVHLYLQQGPEPADTDPPIGTVFTPELAARIVEAVNGADTKLVQVASQLADTRARIRELHQPVPGPGIHLKQCNTCRDQTYPCPTIRAIEEGLGKE